MNLLSFYSPKLINNLVYMLQASEYDASAYLKWLYRTNDMNRVMTRRHLDLTPKARLLILSGWFFIGLQLLVAWLLIASSFKIAAIVLLIFLPVITANLLLIPTWLGQFVIQKPKESVILGKAEQVFSKHTAIKIAVAGSYGKTTMKDALSIVIGTAKRVAVTQSNLNTPLGLAKFSNSLSGNEEVLILEFGESHVGDIKKLCELAHPNRGVITGINEAHLSTFGSIQNAANTIFELADYTGKENIIANGEDRRVAEMSDSSVMLYTRKGFNGWRVENAKADLTGTKFLAIKVDKKLQVEVPLLGEHQIGPMLAVAVTALDLGLSIEQVEQGMRQVKPFEHRFQLRETGGAYVIDDTYNGNIDGMKAGIDFVSKQPGFKRKIFVTPGLVDTGELKQSLHQEIGQLAAAVFNVVVLMKNSNLDFIKQGLEAGKFTGEIKEVDNPLEFYNNLDHFVGKGDLVLMQNDLTDNYA